MSATDGARGSATLLLVYAALLVAPIGDEPREQISTRGASAEVGR